MLQNHYLPFLTSIYELKRGSEKFCKNSSPMSRPSEGSHITHEHKKSGRFLFRSVRPQGLEPWTH